MRARVPLSPRKALLAVLALAVMLAAAYFIFAPHPAKSAPVVTTSTDHPSEQPTTSYHSTATGSQPKYLHLPTIQAEGYIQGVGIDQHNQIAVPTNIHLAGWFTSTVTPGDLGLSIIDGHLDGRTQPGIFSSLSKLKPGDRFSVDLANGTTRSFKVESVQSPTTEEAALALYSQTPGIARQLNLITCGGAYNQSTGYDHRIIITSSLID